MNMMENEKLNNKKRREANGLSMIRFGFSFSLKLSLIFIFHLLLKVWPNLDFFVFCLFLPCRKHLRLLIFFEIILNNSVGNSPISQ